MISQQQHFGQCKYLSIDEGTNIYFGRFRVWNIEAAGSGLSVILPDCEDLPVGGPVFYIINSGEESIDIIDHESSAIVTLAAGAKCKIVLAVNNDSDKAWLAL